MPEDQGRVRRIITRIVNDDNLDLYILGLAALAFTVLGNLGISDLKTLISVLLGLLALLAYSQIRSGRQMSSIVKSQRPDPASLFSDDFPPDLIPRRASATDWLLIGTSLSRTVQTTRIDMRRVLSSGGRVRVLVMDPTDDALAAAAEARYPNLAARRLQNRILTTLDDLALVKEESKGGRLEIRVLPWPPKIGINALDLGKPTGVIYIQHYEHKPTGEARPIFRLEAADGPWRHHFAAEALRLWEDGTPWPLTAEQHLSRRRRPIFMESFSSEVEATVEDAKDLLITGVTRNTLINSSYGKRLMQKPP